MSFAQREKELMKIIQDAKDELQVVRKSMRFGGEIKVIQWCKEVRKYFETHDTGTNIEILASLKLDVSDSGKRRNYIVGMSVALNRLCKKRELLAVKYTRFKGFIYFKNDEI